MKVKVRRLTEGTIILLPTALGFNGDIRYEFLGFAGTGEYTVYGYKGSLATAHLRNTINDNQIIVYLPDRLGVEVCR